MRYDVHVDWDAEAHVWYVTESNVPGLVTEAPTLDAMLEKLEVMVPEMLEENGFHVVPDVPFYVLTRHRGAPVGRKANLVSLRLNIRIAFTQGV